MTVALLDVESLLSPLAGDCAAGPELGYDADFAALELAGAGKPERQYGDKIYAAEPPDWAEVQAQALALAGRTRDLRVAVWLLRSGTRLNGLAGAVQGLQLVHGMLGGLWEPVHPQLDAADHDDPTMRLSALAGLFRSEAVPADLRSAALAPLRGSLRVRDLELGLRRADPAPDETVPTEAGVLQALEALLAQHPPIPEQARAALAAADGICTLLESRLGGTLAPAPEPLVAPLRLLIDALKRLGPSAGGRAEAEATTAAPIANGFDNATGSAGTVAAAPGGARAGIRDRADAVRELERVCRWIEQHEPSNPAPLLIRRAQRLMNMRFIDIIRDLAPDGLDQVTRLAGSDTPA